MVTMLHKWHQSLLKLLPMRFEEARQPARHLETAHPKADAQNQLLPL